MSSPGHVPSNTSSPSSVITGSGGSNSRKRIRMSRCGQCEGCNATNCEKCYKCLDMIKYGGPGTLKQACDRRQCINPQMPGLAPLTSPLQYSPKGILALLIQPGILNYISRIILHAKHRSVIQLHVILLLQF